MKQSLKIIYHVVLIILIILISSHVLALEQSNDDQTISTQEANESAPDLSEIIPRAAKLSGELAILQNMVASLPDISEIEKDFSKVNDKLKGPATQLREINDSKEGRTSKLLEIRKSLERENKILKDIGKPLRKAIRQFGALRNNWQAEKQHWEQWQSTLLKDRDLTQLNSTFEKANHAIDSALEIATSQLNSMLTTQEKAGDVQAEIITLNAKLDALNLTERSGVRGNISPPMFSSQYFYQFSKDLRYTLQTGVSHISWPEGGFFGRQGLRNMLLWFDRQRWHREERRYMPPPNPRGWFS